MEPQYRYDVDLTWKDGKKGVISSPALGSVIEVATTPDFSKGSAGIWSPEHLYISAINSCFMTTFLTVAEKAKLEFINFSCHATGTAEKTDGKYQITDVILKPKVTVSSKNIAKALRILVISNKNCLITNSVKARVHLCPVVESGMKK